MAYTINDKGKIIYEYELENFEHKMDNSEFSCKDGTLEVPAIRALKNGFYKVTGYVRFSNIRQKTGYIQSTGKHVKYPASGEEGYFTLDLRIDKHLVPQNFMDYIKNIERKAIEDVLKRDIVTPENPQGLGKIKSEHIDFMDIYKKDMYYYDQTDGIARKKTKENAGNWKDGEHSDPDNKYYDKNKLLWTICFKSRLNETYEIPYIQKVLGTSANGKFQEAIVQRDIPYANRDEIKQGTLVTVTVQPYAHCVNNKGGVAWKLLKILKQGESNFNFEIPEDDEEDEYVMQPSKAETVEDEERQEGESFDDEIPF